MAINYDISGPDGNAFVILGSAMRWAKQIWDQPEDYRNKDYVAWRDRWSKVSEDAQSSDYAHLLKTIEDAFKVGNQKLVVFHYGSCGICSENIPVGEEQRPGVKFHKKCADEELAGEISKD